MKAPKGDGKELAAAFVKLRTLPSLWLSEGAMDVLRDYMASEETDKPATNANLRNVFESLREQIGIEFSHFLMLNLDRMERYMQEMQRFKLTKKIQNNLEKVFTQITAISNSIGARSILELGGLSSLDEGKDVPDWTKEIEKAMTELNRALNEDLLSKPERVLRLSAKIVDTARE